MPEHLLTDTRLRAPRPKQKEVTLSDGGGLIARCRGSAVTFFYRYRRPDDNGAESKISLGSYPAVSLAAARLSRDKVRNQVADGINPQIARQDEANLRRIEILERVARKTVKDIYDDWKKLYVDHHRSPNGIAETKRLWTKDVLPKIGSVAMADVRKHHMMETIDGAVERGAVVMAGRLLSELRQFFDWALGRGLIDLNPTSGIKKKSVSGPKQSRDRNLSLLELRELLVDRLPNAGLPNSTYQGVRLLLSTGCRVGELLCAEWRHIDLVSSVWTLPTSKSGRQHLIHLSEFSKKAFISIGAVDDSPFVFPARGDGLKAASPKRITKAVSDRQETFPLKNRTVSNNTALLLSVGNWTPHDLRRTMASRLADLGVDFIIIELMLNHELQGVAKVYQRSGRLAERRAAATLWGNLLIQIEADQVDFEVLS